MTDPALPRLQVKERRLHTRHAVNALARLSSHSGTMTCRLIDISAGGARLGLDSLSMPAFRGTDWSLEMPNGFEIRLRPVWCGQSEAGVASLIDETRRANVKRIIAIHYHGIESA